MPSFSPPAISFWTTPYRQQEYNDPGYTFSAWPLPGATARRGRGRVTIPVKPVSPVKPVKPVRSPVNHASSIRRNPLLRRTPSARNYKPDNNGVIPHAPAAPATPSVVNTHSSGAGVHSDAKESMTVSASYNSYAGKKNKLAQVNREDDGTKKDDYSKEISPAGHHKTAIIRDGKIKENNSTRNKEIDLPQYTSSNQKKFTLACFDFTNTINTIAYLKEQHYQGESNFFCVDYKNEKLFRSLFKPDLHIESDQNIAAMLTIPCRHNLPENNNTLKFSRYVTHGDIKTTTDDDKYHNDLPHLYSVVAISLIPPNKLKPRHLHPDRILSANSFKIFYFSDASGHYQHFIAFHTNQHESGNGFNAGIYRLDKKNGVFIFQHPPSGFEFSSSSLEKLTSGLVRVTGLKYQFDSNKQSKENEAAIIKIEPTYTQSLFIDNNQTMSSEVTRNKINNNLHFIPSFLIEDHDEGSNLRLVKESFTIINNTLYYVDVKGVKGEMPLNTSDTDPGKIKIFIKNQQEADLFNHLGISLSTEYSHQDLISLMDAKGISYLPSGENINISLPARKDDFYMDIIYPRENEILDNFPLIEGMNNTESTQHSYCFSMMNQTLYYYDEKSQLQKLRFNRNPFLDMYQLPEETSAEERLFYREVNITPSTFYSKDELFSLLEKKFYVNYPDMPLKKI